MNQIDNLTNNANQVINFILEDSSVVVINLVFNAAVQRWTLNVLRGTFVVNSINVSIFPNMLREWRNIIPFGIACLTVDGADPIAIDDFTNGRASLYVLNAADVSLVEATLLGEGL